MPASLSPSLPPPGGETLARRVDREGPLHADAAWLLACRLLDAIETLHASGSAHGNLAPENILLPDGADGGRPLTLLNACASLSADAPGAVLDDLAQTGAVLWFALTGGPPETPLSWQRLDSAGITADLGALPVLIARVLTGDPAQRPATVPALRDTLKVLASLRPAVPVCADMPIRASGSDPVAPTPEGRPSAPMDSELWTRTPAQLALPHRRRSDSAQVWNTLVLLAAGGVAGFFGGVLYEKNHGAQSGSSALASIPAATPPPALSKATPVPTPATLPPAQPVSPGGMAARLERISTLQPDVRDVLKYARELRRVGTVPVTDPAFPSDAELSALAARFDWTAPGSPNFRRTPLLLVLGYDEAGAEASQALAEAMVRGLAHAKIKSPVYSCGMGNADKLAEVQTEGVGSGQFVEVWVAFTLF